METSNVHVAQTLSDKLSPCSSTNTQVFNRWSYLDKYWKFIGPKADNKNLVFQCLLCTPLVKKISTNNKSQFNLKKHINRVHAHKVKEFQQCVDAATLAARKRRKSRTAISISEEETTAKQLKLSESVGASQCNSTQEIYEEKMTAIFVENMLPLHMVDSFSFQDFMKTCAPEIKTMSKRTLTRRIEENYNNNKQKLKKLLDNVSFVATTADLWSCRNRSYIGMTCHWIDQHSFKREQVLLTCRRTKGCHSFDAIAKEIENIHWDFQIESKVVRTTTDNGSNFVKAFNVFQSSCDDSANPSSPSNTSDHGLSVSTSCSPECDKVDDAVSVDEITPLLQELETPGNECGTVLPKHMRCAVHTLNLVCTTDADKALHGTGAYRSICRTAFAKAQELWNKQSRSSKAADLIKDKIGFLLKVPNITRWNSVFDAVGQLVQIFETRNKQNGLNSVCNTLQIPSFSKGDVHFFREYHRVMSPVNRALTVIQGEENAYMGILLPTLATCLNDLKKMDEAENLTVCPPLLRAIMQGIQTRFATEFDDVDCFLASAFHPHFKMVWVDYLDGLEYDKQKMIRRTRCNMISLLEGRVADLEISGDLSYGDDFAGDNFFSSLYLKVKKSNDSVAKLVHTFLKESPKPEADITKASFPNIHFQELFRKYNTAIPSSTGVERLFSLEKDVLKPGRADLSDEHFEMLVFLKGNASNLC